MSAAALDLSLLSESGSGSLAELEREHIAQLEQYLRYPSPYVEAAVPRAIEARELLVAPNLTSVGSTLHEVNLRAASAQVEILSARCEALDLALKEAGERCGHLEGRAGSAEREKEEVERRVRDSPKAQ